MNIIVDDVFYIGGVIMNDKILQIKKEINQIIKSKRTRIEIHNLVKEKIKLLDNIEREILLKEYKRDLVSYNILNDIKDLISTGFTGIGFLLTIFGIFCTSSKQELSFSAYSSILFSIGLYIMAVIFIIVLVQNYKSKKLKEIQYAIDILED